MANVTGPGIGDVETVASGPGVSGGFTVPSGVTGHPPPHLPTVLPEDFSDQRGLRVRLSHIRGETPKKVLRTPLWLPAVLGDMQLEELATFTDVLSHRDGEHSYPAAGGQNARMLRTLPFDFLTLDWKAPWLQKWQNPDWIVGQLQDIIRSKKPVALLGTLNSSPRRRPTEFRTNVTIRRLARTLRPGEADTRYLTVELKEWRPSQTKKRATSSGHRYHLPTTHKLTAKDTLESLAKKYYGNKKHWRAIGNFNGLESWGPRTPLVKHSRYKVGTKIKIPKLPADEHDWTAQGSGFATGTGQGVGSTRQLSGGGGV